jgi:hypothetical protein
MGLDFGYGVQKALLFVDDGSCWSEVLSIIGVQSIGNRQAPNHVTPSLKNVRLAF